MIVKLGNTKSSSVMLNGKCYDTGIPIEMPYTDMIALWHKGLIVEMDYNKVPYNPEHWQNKKFGMIAQIDRSSGYGNATYNLIKYSQLAGYWAYWSGRLVGDSDKVIERARLAEPPENIGMIFHEQPHQYWLSSPYQKNLAILPFETTRIPASWLPKIAKMDGLMVPCKMNIQMMKDSGVTIPVELIHWGIDDKLFYPLEREDDGVFTFGHMGSLSIRKGTDLVLEAFKRAFPPQVKDVRLINKTSAVYYPFMVKDNRVMVQQTYNGVPHQELIDEFFKKIDIMVYPSRGEGFGLPPLEGMATGVPAITTDWGGMKEYNTDEYGWTLKDFKFVVAEDFNKKVYKEDCGNWTEPSIDELVEVMRYAYAHQDEVKEKGRKAAEYVKQEWLWENKIKMFFQALNKHL